jgi:hypothetical protein
MDLLLSDGDPLDACPQKVTLLSPVGDLPRPFHPTTEFAEGLRLHGLANR